MTGFNFDIPDELHTRFKVISVLEKKDMQDILIELIEKYVKKKEVN